MSSNAIDVLAAALSLPCHERTELARRLLLSLENDLVNDGPVGATRKDIHERMTAIESGDFRVEDAKTVLSELRQALASGDQEPRA